jgi:hypothetical protein
MMIVSPKVGKLAENMTVPDAAALTCIPAAHTILIQL